jgi:hypothetical protein
VTESHAPRGAFKGALILARTYAAIGRSSDDANAELPSLANDCNGLLFWAYRRDVYDGPFFPKAVIRAVFMYALIDLMFAA